MLLLTVEYLLLETTIKTNPNACILIKEEGSVLEINNGEFHANADENLWVPIIDIKII